jgi:hypothetical protein
MAGGVARQVAPEALYVWKLGHPVVLPRQQSADAGIAMFNRWTIERLAVPE